jgi:hypothetical protein
MNAIINLFAKYSGAAKIWDMLDGIKAYMVGTVTILSGAAGILQEFLKVEGSHNFAAMLTFAQGIPHDPMWLMVLAGCAIIAAAHKADKVIAAVNTPAPVAEPAPIQVQVINP